MNERSSSPVEVTVSTCEHEEKHFAVIQVNEFAEFPAICTRNGHAPNNQQILRQGALYIRSRRRVESAEVSSEAEMRELLQRAIDKGVDKELTRLREWGLVAGVQPTPEEASRRAFDEQLERDRL